MSEENVDILNGLIFFIIMPLHFLHYVTHLLAY